MRSARRGTADRPQSPPIKTLAWENVIESVQARPALAADVDAIKELVDHYAGTAVLGTDLATLHENLAEFSVAEIGGTLVGCGALHVLRSDLGEIRTMAVDPQHRGAGIGRALMGQLLHRAREGGLRWLFALTFETRFFGRHGFQPVRETPLSGDDTAEPAHSEGVAQYLDLARVKPNTLGNTRMLLELDARSTMNA